MTANKVVLLEEGGSRPTALARYVPLDAIPHRFAPISLNEGRIDPPIMPMLPLRDSVAGGAASKVVGCPETAPRPETDWQLVDGADAGGADGPAASPPRTPPLSPALRATASASGDLAPTSTPLSPPAAALPPSESPAPPKRVAGATRFGLAEEDSAPSPSSWTGSRALLAVGAGLLAIGLNSSRGQVSEAGEGLSRAGGNSGGDSGLLGTAALALGGFAAAFCTPFLIAKLIKGSPSAKKQIC